MFKVKKKHYKIIDDFTINGLDYLIQSEGHEIRRKYYKINKTRDDLPDTPEHLKDLLANIHEDDDEDYDD